MPWINLDRISRAKIIFAYFAGYFEKVSRDGLEMRMGELRRLQDAGRLLHPLEDYRRRLDEEIKIIRQADQN